MTLSHLSLKSLLCGALFALILLAGLFLHKTGRPFPSLLFNLHKMATVVWIILSIHLLVKVYQLHPPGSLMIVSTGISTVALLTLLVSGGMMSLDKIPELMLHAHRIATWALLASYPLLLVRILSLNHSL